MTAVLGCHGLTVRYDDTTVLDRLDLDVSAGETVALLGPSGAGKTTLLYAIAGLIEPDSGTIEIDGRTVAGSEAWVPPEDRSTAMVFQNYALWPHLTALETVAYPALRRGATRVEAEERARRLLEALGIAELADRHPDELSGGQQQRVGVARALAAEPQLFLFDEPTAHLDAALRVSLQRELVEQRAGAAAIYATHDPAEALSVADRVAVLRRGRVVQIGAPEEVYASPIDLWTARLTGPASVLRGRVTGSEVDVLGTVHPTEHEAGDVEVLVRPDWVASDGPLEGRVEMVRYEGPFSDHVLRTPAGTVVLREGGPPRHDVGDRVGFGLERVWVLADGGDGTSAG